MQSPFIPYTTVVGDRWDTIAWKFYGSQFLAAMLPLVQANPSIPRSAVLPAGTTIGVPILEAAATDAADLPPWGTI